MTVACPRTSILWTEAERLGLDRVPTDPRRASPIADVPDLIRLLRLCRRADVIHAHSSKSGLVARLAATLAGRRNRCVFTPHGWSFWALGGTAGRLAVALERIAAHGCARIIAVSTFASEAGLTRGIGPERRFRVVPNGVPDPRPEGSSVDAHAADRLVMVSLRLAPPPPPPPRRRSARPGPPSFGQEVTLALVGDGPLRPRVEGAVAQHRLEGAVDLLGERNDVADLLVHASCAVHLSTYERRFVGRARGHGGRTSGRRRPASGAWTGSSSTG